MFADEQERTEHGHIREYYVPGTKNIFCELLEISKCLSSMLVYTF